ncbi:MAG: hypothetical protein ACTSYD_15055 [Candidatus Heimdallarchaeaceae archaeon]
MQAPTHILTGILLLEIFRSIFPTAPLWVQIVVVFPICVVSHFIIDALAIFTYHPPKADWKDWFWVSYHFVIYVGAVVILVFFLVDYWWVIIAANLLDLIDWLILRPIFKKKPVCHPIADKLRNFLFKKAPNWNHKRWTIIIEFVIVGMLLTLVLLLQKFNSAG